MLPTITRLYYLSNISSQVKAKRESFTKGIYLSLFPWCFIGYSDFREESSNESDKVFECCAHLVLLLFLELKYFWFIEENTPLCSFFEGFIWSVHHLLLVNLWICLIKCYQSLALAWFNIHVLYEAFGINFSLLGENQMQKSVQRYFEAICICDIIFTILKINAVILNRLW